MSALSEANQHAKEIRKAAYAKAMNDAADVILTALIREPDGGAEEHANWVMESLADELRAKARKA